MTHRTVRTSIVVAASMLVSACDDGSGPANVTFDVASASAALGAVRGVVMSAGVAGHLALAPRFATPGEPLRYSVDASLFQQIAILPATHFGTTFGIADGQGTYGPTQIPGAPADALRFLLYALDTEGEPVAESAIGHADLTDEGIELENGFAIGIRAVADETIVAEYTASFLADGPVNSANALTARFDHVGLRLAGTLRSTVDAIAFDVVTGTVNGVVTTEFAITSGEATISGRMAADQQTQAGSLQAELQVADDVLVATALGVPNSFIAEVTVNGATWATVDVQQGVVTVSAGGNALGATEESVALRLAEYFLTIPHLTSGLIVGVLEQ